MREYLRRATVPMLLGILGCAAAVEQPAVDTAAGEGLLSAAADEAAIRTVRQDRFAASFMAGDPEGFLSVVTEDAVIMPPDEPPVAGHTAIRAWLEAFFAGYVTDLEYTGSAITVAGDWAVEAYAFRWTLTPTDGSEPIRDQGKGVYVFRRQPDGSWKVARDIWNYTPAGAIE